MKTMKMNILKPMLVSHITFSVGWLGAVTVFIVLAVTGLTSVDNQVSRSALLALDICAWFVIVPFCVFSLFTGLVQALGTKWGLFKHYWIVVKLFLTLAMTILLLLHLQPISYLANVAMEPSFSKTNHATQLLDIIIKAGAALVVLIVITTISIYKPLGKIQRTQSINYKEYLQGETRKSEKSWKIYLLIGLGLIIVLIIIKHLFGGGMHSH